MSTATIAPADLDWESVFREYHHRIYAYIKRRIHRFGTSEEDVEDLTSTVFLRLVEAANRGVCAHTHFSGYLFRIAHNIVIDEYRRRDKQGVAIEFESLAEVALEGPGPFEQISSTLNCECIWQSIGTLTDKQEKIIMLHAQGGYRYKDIAQEVGLPVTATKQLLVRGRGRLKKILVTKGYAT